MTDGAGGLGLILEIQRAIAEEYGWPDGRMETHTLTKVDPSTLRDIRRAIFSAAFVGMVVTLDS